MTLEFRISTVVFTVLLKPETGTLRAFFFALSEGEIYNLEIHCGFSIKFWPYIQVFSSKTAHTFFYLPC